MQEEAQQRHEQKLSRLAHGASRGHCIPSNDSLAASVSACSEPGKVLMRIASKRPDTAYEGGSVPADLTSKTARSSITHPVADSGTIMTPSDVGLGTLRDQKRVTLESGAIVQAEKLPYRAHLCSKTLDSLSLGPEPPNKAGGKVKPSPRPRQLAFKKTAA